MAKLKSPLLSLSASASLGKEITFQKRSLTHFARKKPSPIDPHTLLQIYHRWDYQDYAHLWHALSIDERQQWETNARRLRITGFNYFLSTRLKTLPDLVARYHLDERTGTIAHDSSKSENHLTLHQGTHMPAFIDFGLYFDGVDDYGRKLTPAKALTTTDSFSIEALLEPYTLGNWKPLVNLAVNYMRRHLMYSHYNLPCYVTTLADDTVPFYYGTTTGLAVGEKLHLILTYDYPTLTYTFYQNGDYTNHEVAPATEKYIHYAIDLARASHQRGHFLGDEVRIYNRCLTATEAKRHSERRYP